MLRQPFDQQLPQSQPPLTASQLSPSSATGANTGNLNMFSSLSQSGISSSSTTSWGSLSNSGIPGNVNDPFAASHGARERSQYQPGYLMQSTTQQQPQHQPSSFSDDPPLLPSKSHSHPHTSPQRPFGYASEFGTESLFQRSTTRSMLNDEDAPPTASVMDIPNSLPSSSSAGPRFSSFSTPSRPSAEASSQHQTPQQEAKQQPHFLLVYGYVSAAYSQLSQSFSLMGDTTNPEPDSEGGNWFVIGFRKEADARRALGRDGEMGRENGTPYMIGVKPLDPNKPLTSGPSTPKGLTTTSSALIRGPFGGPSTGTGSGTSSPLAPASSAFRKPEPPKPKVSSSNTQVANTGAGTSGSGWAAKISDVIFGW